VRNFFSLDATCPLVTKVHREGRDPFQSAAREIFLIGPFASPRSGRHARAIAAGCGDPDRDRRGCAHHRARRNPNNLAFVTQTTLSIDDTAHIVTILKERFPNINGPHKEDICYATTNRQLAVKKVAPVVDALIVVGAPQLVETRRRLREVAEREGCPISVLAQTRPATSTGSGSKASRASASPRGASAPEVNRRGDHGRVPPSASSCTWRRSRPAEENEFLPAAAFGAARRGVIGTLQHGGFTPTSAADELADFLSEYDIGELLSYKGHRRGRREFELPGAYQQGAPTS